MRPPVWQPPVDRSTTEQTIVRLIRRAQRFVFLRQHRHELVDAGFQRALAETYRERPNGQPPVPPAPTGLATILQA